MPDDAPRALDGEERKAAVFINGRSKAVRIPKAFEFEGDQVMIRKSGDELIIRPIRRQSDLLEYLTAGEPIEDDFDFGEDLPAEPVDL